jgi:TonB family protein
LTAFHAPLPDYPHETVQGGKSGLVVIEVVVPSAGRVTESLILETFDDRASAAVVDAVKAWRFRSQQEMIAAGLLRFCSGCIRINRLAFDFRLERGEGRVVDLAAEELKRLGEPDPFKSRKQ